MKNKILTPVFSFLLIISLVSCSSSDDSDTPPQRTYADVQADFANIVFNTGVNDVSIVNTNGITWNFRVVMPDVDFSNNDRPLIMTLHGASGGDPNAHKNTDCYAEPGFASLDPIIISPNGGANLWTTFTNQEMVLTLVDLARDYLPVDNNKVVVNGYSNGGNGSWFFAETQASFFSAGIPMASHYNTINNGVGRVIPIPLYVIHGEDDELFPLSDVQNWVQASIDSGSDITLEVAPGLMHIEPCEYVQYLQNAATWLQNSVWN